MSRPRTNDPSNLPKQPNLVSDPVRERELVAEFQRRLRHLQTCYKLSRKIGLDQKTYNDSIERLRRAIVRKRAIKRRGKRLHPEVELLLSHHAKRLAAEEGVEVLQKHVNQAAVIVVDTFDKRRGRPDDPVLKHFVTGLVAIIQEATGRPVIASRTRDSVYDPHFAKGASSLIPLFFNDLGAGVTETQLVNIVRSIRSEYAGKPLRFLDLFPLYGAKDGPEGLELRGGMRFEAFEPNIPIYCP